MPALTPHVGVRTLLNTEEKAPFLIADMSTIGGAFTAPTADATKFPLDTPVSFTTDDAAMVAAIGATGTLKETVDAIVSEGIIARIVAVRVGTDADIEDQMGLIVGSPSAKTGLYALLDAGAETGDEPDLIMAPGYTGQRLGGAANPAAAAIDAICDRIMTAIGLCDGPGTTNVDAAAWAADFVDTMNIVCIDPPVRVWSGSSVVTRPASPHLAACIVRGDKGVGGPYASPSHPDFRALKGIVGPARPVSFRIDDPDCDANWLLQRGVGTIVDGSRLVHGRPAPAAQGVKGKLLWCFFNTFADPLWRDIKVVRIRKMVREVIPRTLARYVGRNLGAHLVTVLCQSIDEFINGELKPIGAVLGGEVKWERALNSNATLRTGGLHVTLNFEEAPTVVDIVVHTGRYERAFDILADEIEALLAQYDVRGQLPTA